MQIHKISIITATYQAESKISNLILSLKKNEKFIHEWIIVDNFSTDSTLKIIKNHDFKFITKLIIKKTTIYEAFNEGLKNLTSNFYMILGSDDWLLDNGLNNFFKNVKLHNEIMLYILPTIMNGKIINKKIKNNSILGAHHLVNSHSAGLIINLISHQKVGYYSNDYFYASDSDFIIKVFKNKLKILRPNIIVGCFGIDGSTNNKKNIYKLLFENYKVMIRNNFSYIIQTFLLIIRILKNSYKLL